MDSTLPGKSPETRPPLRIRYAVAPLMFAAFVAVLSYASFAVHFYVRLNGSGEGGT